MARHEAYLGSDAFALAPFTNRVAYLEDGDVVGGARARRSRSIDARGPARQPRGHDHHAPPPRSSTRAASATSWRRRSTSSPKSSATRWRTISMPSGPNVALRRDGPRRGAGRRRRASLISACGTAYYAGLVGKYWFEKLARLPVEVDVASELRYRDPVYRRRRRRALHLAIGRDGRHAGGAARCQGARPDDARARQRAGKLDRARSRHRAADLRRARDRRRLDQGLHLPARGAGRARHRGGPRARHADRRRRRSGSAPRCSKSRATSSRC